MSDVPASVIPADSTCRSAPTSAHRVRAAGSAYNSSEPGSPAGRRGAYTRRLRPALLTAGCVLAAAGLFLAYLRMARAVTVNSDGASNAIQAWDLFHGNVLLRGWTLSDVSFYPTELIQYGLIQLVTGVSADQIHVAAAMSWTLVVFLAAYLAHRVVNRVRGLAPLLHRPAERGRSRIAWVPAAVTVAILLVPAPGPGYQTLLSSPNHTGSAVPLLLTWLLVERTRDSAWSAYAVAGVLTLGAMGDPLITFVGAVPVVAVSLLGALRRRELRGPDARLAAAALVSVALSHTVLWVIERVGGFRAPRPPIHLSPLSQWPERAGTVARMLGILFGTDRPGVRGHWVEGVLQAVHLPGLVLAGAALLLAAVGAVRATADRLDALLAVAVGCNLGAEIVSTLPIDLPATREVAPVLPMLAVLAARLAARGLSPRPEAGPVIAGHPSDADAPATASAPSDADAPGDAGAPATAGAWSDADAGAGAIVPPAARPRAADITPLASGATRRSRFGFRRLRTAMSGPWPRRATLGLLAVVGAVQIAALAGYAPPRAEPIEGQAAADWLRDRGLRYGLGSYWVSNNITVATARRVTVVPVLSGAGRLLTMCWQTNTEMFDASRHDARFVLLEKERPMYGTPADVLAQFGSPTLRQDLGKYTIFVYDRNLLPGLRSAC